MRFIYSSFIMSVMRMNHIRTQITSQLAKESFVGSWFVNENDKQHIIHLKPQGMIYKSTDEKSDYVGYWETKEDYFYFNLRDNHIEKKYYGKLFNNTLNVSGQVCEGLSSPNRVGISHCHYCGQSTRNPTVYYTLPSWSNNWCCNIIKSANVRRCQLVDCMENYIRLDNDPYCSRFVNGAPYSARHLCSISRSS